MEKTFRMDGKAIPFKDGETVMDAALRAGEYIPHLVITRIIHHMAVVVFVW